MKGWGWGGRDGKGISFGASCSTTCPTPTHKLNPFS